MPPGPSPTSHCQSRLGEIEGIDLTLRFLRDKRTQAQRLQQITRNVDLGLPAVRATKES